MVFVEKVIDPFHDKPREFLKFVMELQFGVAAERDERSVNIPHNIPGIDGFPDAIDNGAALRPGEVPGVNLIAAITSHRHDLLTRLQGQMRDAGLTGAEPVGPSSLGEDDDVQVLFKKRLEIDFCYLCHELAVIRIDVIGIGYIDARYQLSGIFNDLLDVFGHFLPDLLQGCLPVYVVPENAVFNRRDLLLGNSLKIFPDQISSRGNGYIVSPVKESSQYDVTVILALYPRCCMGERILSLTPHLVLERPIVITIRMVEGEDYRLVFRDVFEVFEDDFNPGNDVVVRDEKEPADEHLDVRMGAQVYRIEMVIVDQSVFLLLGADAGIGDGAPKLGINYLLYRMSYRKATR